MEKLHVLVIEDEADNFDLLKKELEAFEYEVSHADNLKDALGLYYTISPDIVIVDIFLHGQKDGIEFARKICENPSTLRPFLFLTSASDRNTFSEAKLTGPYSYLIKPFNPLELEYAIELAIEKYNDEVINLGVQTGYSSCFLVKKQNKMFKIEPKELDYIKVESRYCELYSGKEMYVVQSSLKEMLHKLPENLFVRIHRNYLVNFKQVKEIAAQDATVILKDGTELLLSRRYLDEIKKHVQVIS